MNQWYLAHIVLVQSSLTSFLLALSIHIPLRTGLISFAGVGFYGIGAYGTAILVKREHFGTFSALVSATLLAAGMAVLLGLMVRRLSGLYLGMATIAFDLILGVVALNGGSLTGGALGLYGVISQPKLTTTAIALVCCAAAIVLALTERGRLGRRVDAVRDDPQLAMSVGVSVHSYRLAAFVVSAVLGSLGGGMNILLRTTIAPGSVDFSLIVLALTMVIVGGARSWLGAAVGAIVFTWLPTALSFVGRWQAIVYGLLVAVVAVYVPGGFVGACTDLVRRLRRDRGSWPVGRDVSDIRPVPSGVGHVLDER